MKKVLIIEDEHTINDVISEYLKEEGYKVVQTYNGIEGIMKFNDSVDFIICDVMMPKLDGYSVVEEVRKTSDVPIIMLTALNQEEDILKGYDLGVDEYVSKPFSPKIIVKKVNAILNRKKETFSEELLEKGRLAINQEMRKALIDGKEITLTKKEFELLALFMTNESIVFSRDKLLNLIWGYDYFGDDRVVDTCIKRLRKKINPLNNYVKTVFGVGYKFEVDL